MSIDQGEGLQPSRVTALFEGNAVSFVLSQGTTFEELASRLDHLGERNNGAPVAIAVKFFRAAPPLTSP